MIEKLRRDEFPLDAAAPARSESDALRDASFSVAEIPDAPPIITARRGFHGVALDTNLRGGTGLAAMGGADFRAWAASLLHGGGATGADAMVM